MKARSRTLCHILRSICLNPNEIVSSLALEIRTTVRPHLGKLASRHIEGIAASGDATFAIDEIAERAIVSFIESHGLSIAYYSEDRGLVEFGSAPKGVLVIDPIDGTRPAAAGFEACVVSVAYAEYSHRPTMADVTHGCIVEIKSGDTFLTERGGGVRWTAGTGELCVPQPLPIQAIRDAPVSFEVVARPFEWIGLALSGIVDDAALRGGCFVFNSTAFSLTRLITGQLAIVIDIGNRILRDHPASHSRFAALGGGRSIGLYSYDIAAAALLATEAGAIVTDAYGNSFDDMPLLDTSETNLASLVAASNPELHAKALAEVERGMRRLSIN